jgi:hypothetical protein
MEFNNCSTIRFSSGFLCLGCRQQWGRTLEVLMLVQITMCMFGCKIFFHISPHNYGFCNLLADAFEAGQLHFFVPFLNLKIYFH